MARLRHPLLCRSPLLLLCWLLLSWLGLAHADTEFLPPAQAFRPSVAAVNTDSVVIRYDIAQGYYLYRDRFKFELAKAGNPAGVTLGTPLIPAGKVKDDPNFGKVETLRDSVDITLPLAGASQGVLQLESTAQGCADAGLCYPPNTQTLSIDLATAGSPAAGGGDSSGQIAGALRHAGFWTSLLFFFLAGLGLSLTPCIFPMIPILSGIIVGSHGKGQVGRGRGFTLSLAYVLGMAVTYAAVGVLAGLTGSLLSNALQNAWVLGGFALLFVALSGSMFGFYELQLPAFLQSKVSAEANQLHGGSLPAVTVMGALSALICGPCVAAPLAGALLYIGQTHDAVLGGAALFVLAIGMGMPLLLVGLSAGTLLPRSGPWMEAVKKFFGVVLLGTALWFVQPVIPPVAAMLGWALLLIVPAIYLHALDPLPPAAHGWQRFWKGMGVVLLLTGAALLLGALAGHRDPLQPLAFLTSARAGSSSASETHLPFRRVQSVAELDAAIATAGKPVMLDFYADWCVSCKEMERYTFSDPAVRQQLAGFVLLQADVTANTAADAALLQRFKLFGPPGIIFFDSKGQELASPRVVGFMEAAPFGKLLATVAQR